MKARKIPDKNKGDLKLVYFVGAGDQNVVWGVEVEGL